MSSPELKFFPNVASIGAGRINFTDANRDVLVVTSQCKSNDIDSAEVVWMIENAL